MDITTTEYIIGGITGVLTMVQLLYLLVLYGAPHRRYKAEAKAGNGSTEQRPGMSVIITTSDQADSLAKNLPLILEQDYPDFEVIVVDDNSSDDTRELLERLAKQYTHLYSTFTSDSIRYISHKKLALTLGIKAAKKEWVVFTEPNCYPTSRQWLARMARHCTDANDVVIAYSNYERRPGFGNLCYTYDTMLQQVRLLGITLLGGGYMGNGRNMAYRRELFFTHKGYSRHLDLERGDDDLFINEHVAARRITADISADSVVRCTSTSGRTWQNEKLNRLFTRKKMSGASIAILSADTLTRIMLYASVTLGIAMGIINQWWVLMGVSIALWMAYLGCSICVFHRIARELGERRYNVSLPLFDLIRPCWELYFRLHLRFSSKDMYKRRKV